MAKLTIYTTRWCGHCVRAKALLEARGLSFEEVDMDHGDPDFRGTLNELSGASTVPQIVIDATPIGGYAELLQLDRSGALATLTG
jgi:glutaredoxin 3